VAVPRILHLSTYDAHGGAARAAFSIHKALLDAGISSRMRVGSSSHKDPTIVENKKYPFMLAKEADRRLWAFQHSDTPTWRSPARFGSISAREINASKADVVHLHWVTDGFMSVETIGAIRKPIIWSLCDAWAFSGAEHYATQISARRSIEGYTKLNRPTTDSGIDIDRWTWERKVKHWKTPMHIVPASTWLTSATQSSALMGAWPITRIPHIVNTEIFMPKDQMEARKLIGISSDRPVILFLASAGINDRRKGWDLLCSALESPVFGVPLTVVIVGPKPTKAEQDELSLSSQHRFIFFGEAHGDEELVALYNAADITAVPSREDNMPITAMESQSCGTPVLAFAIGGLPDIVNHGISGFLAEPNHIDDLKQGLISLLKHNQRDAVRKHALKTWSPQAVVPQLLDIYESARA